MEYIEQKPLPLRGVLRKKNRTKASPKIILVKERNLIQSPPPPWGAPLGSSVCVCLYFLCTGLYAWVSECPRNGAADSLVQAKWSIGIVIFKIKYNKLRAKDERT